MKRIRHIAILAVALSITFIVWAQSYTFDAQKATVHLTAHGRARSIHCCAWYTMRALQAGGCPAIILPAQWYSYFMPLVQFEEVKAESYTPRAGDVVVFERPKGRSWKKISKWWGHIAMYNGEQWISDFKQKRMNPYRTAVPYRIYRYKRNALTSKAASTFERGLCIVQAKPRAADCSWTHFHTPIPPLRTVWRDTFCIHQKNRLSLQHSSSRCLTHHIE